MERNECLPRRWLDAGSPLLARVNPVTKLWSNSPLSISQRRPWSSRPVLAWQPTEMMATGRASPERRPETLDTVPGRHGLKTRVARSVAHAGRLPSLRVFFLPAAHCGSQWHKAPAHDPLALALECR